MRTHTHKVRDTILKQWKKGNWKHNTQLIHDMLCLETETTKHNDETLYCLWCGIDDLYEKAMKEELEKVKKK